MKENRSKRVTFRVTEEEYKQLEELAYGSYRLISVYCRDCVFGKKITVIPSVDDAAKQLRRIGNNLNQLTWRVNEGTLTAVNLEETKRELAKIFEKAKELGISQRTVNEAKLKNKSIVTKKIGKRWFWAIPVSAEETA